MFVYRFRSFLGLALALAILPYGCGRSASTVEASTVQTETVPHVRDADDVARFIAGLPGKDGSPFANLETGEAWKEHQRQLDDAWGKADKQLISGLREFQKQELNSESLRNSVVFYPFSGPDALTMTVFFPQSPVYVMVGLEPAGTLPTPAQIERKDIAKYLADVRETMASELGRSFFITRQMDRQFRGQVTDGLLLPILHLLVRTHDTILGFRYIRLDEDGRVIDRLASYKAPTRYGNKGVEIEFRAEADQSIHHLYYFSVNISDERLKENTPFLAYLSRLTDTTTMLKATSYMTHRTDFSWIREEMLANSSAILQDDSGIPYRYFRPDSWSVQLYGSYDRPYGSFRWLEQPNLRKAYEGPGAKPLALHLGYGYSKIASNLLFAKRIN
jgi:hypothetical protein